MNGVFQFVSGHPYLFANLPTLAAVILLPRMAPNRDFQRAAVFSGVACLPCSLAELSYGEYWHPVLLGGMHYGLESLSFTYATGALAWLTAGLWSIKRCTAGTRSFSAAFLRLAPWAIAVTAVYIALLLGGMNCLTASLVPSACLLLFLLVRRASLWRLALSGLASFTVVYLLAVRLDLAVWPDFVSYWNPTGPWGARFLGIPCGEMVWAAVFGAVWPVVIASALDIRFGDEESQAVDGAVGAASYARTAASGDSTC